MHKLFVSLGPFTQASILIIVILAIGLHLRWSRKVAATGPALLTTFGIFFCFAGITWGLVEFNPTDVRDSVPHLLQGIRTSFWASVFGIGSALTIKMRALLFGDPSPSKDAAKSGATIDDLVDQLRRVNRSIAATDDGTLLEELRRSRTDSNDRLDGLNRSLEQFLHTMVDANSAALTQSLSAITRDFNSRLGEQFGQNFKELNLAVGKMVVWQQQYEKQLNALIEQETSTRHNLSEASLRFAELVDKASVQTFSADWLRTLLAQTNAQSERLNASLRNLAELVTAQIEQGARVSHDTLSAVLK
ncbi:MAG: hypothetical protein M3O06_07500, partial [Pseudomonadota bacterium]|nr:hypothetical protein [Pseudomonadota bacterium]